MLVASLAASTFAEPGRILGLEEVERRLRAQREAVTAIGLAVPTHVRIVESSQARTEQRWELG